MAFRQLSEEERGIVVYSENRNYWVHLEPIVQELLADKGVKFCYVSSNSDDPGLEIDSSNCRIFEIGSGVIRDYFFSSLEAGIMVMTMPDIENYQVKRSPSCKHYVYIQHSVASLHSIYREGAFDHYDTIFCAGPHHEKEILALAQHRGISKPNVFPHGYGRLDSLLSGLDVDNEKSTAEIEHVLIGPSWGDSGIIDSSAYKIIDLLLKEGLTVTLRPHPESFKRSKPALDKIMATFESNVNFTMEVGVDGSKSLRESDLLITDWSGISIDYAFAYRKPVLFIDTPQKIQNSDYQYLNIAAFEETIREKIGRVVGLTEIKHIVNIVKDTDFPPITDSLITKHVYNIGTSGAVAKAHICALYSELMHPNAKD